MRGLRLVGNAELSMNWEKGKIVSAEIKADSDYHTMVLYEGQSREIMVKAGEILCLEV